MQEPPKEKPNLFWYFLFSFCASALAVITALLGLSLAYRLLVLLFGQYSSTKCTYTYGGVELTTPICEEKTGRMTLDRVFPSEAIIATGIGLALFVILGFVVIRLYKRCFKTNP